MLKNFFKIAFRNILRDKYFTFINVVGLAIGLASGLLIFSYVIHELSYDNFHPDADRLYRVDQTNIWDPRGGIMGSTGLPLAHVLVKDYPEIELSLRINTPYNQVIRYEKENGEVLSVYEDMIYAADSTFFSFFHFPLKEGNAETALIGRNKAVVSDVFAKKFFGDESALGKTIYVGDERIPVEITGVTEKQPDNVHFNFNCMLSIYTNPDATDFEWSWIWTQVVTYIKVAPGTDPASLQEKFEIIASKYVAPTFARFGILYEDFIKDKDGWNFYLKPVRDIHLHSVKEDNRIGPVSDIKYIYIFSSVGIFVLIIAIINFVNLSTARGANRAKEVGVKKVLGAQRTTLILQFQFESILLALTATLLGLGIMELLKIGLLTLLREEFSFITADSQWIWFVPVFSIIVGVIAGLYPSFYLTAFRPASVLKGKLALGFRKSSLRNILVTTQFVISISFIAAAILVYQQLNYFGEMSLGFKKENVLVIDHAEKLGSRVESFVNEVKKSPYATSVSLAMNAPGSGAPEDIFTREGDEARFPLGIMKADEQFLPIFEIELLAGRNFDVNRPSDENAVILNEKSAQLLGWTPEEAIGKRIIYLGDDVSPPEVIGVTKDFHYYSARYPIGPVIIFHVKSNMYGDSRVVSIKYASDETRSLLTFMEKKWKEMLHDAPFEHFFLEENWKYKYREEEQLGTLFAVFTILSIVIAMMGLIGLVTYSSEQRRKEIGIRKVMGASVNQMVVLLNSNFAKLVLVAFGLSVPLCWYFMHEWLRQFPYKIEIELHVFLLAGAVMLLITLITVSFQSWKTANTNPVDVLKDE